MTIEEIVKPSGILCRKHGQENQQPDAWRNHEAGTNRHAVEERVHQHSDQRRDADNGIHDFIVMGFFAEVQMRSKRVLEHVHDAGIPEAQASGADFVSAMLSGIISRKTVPSMKPEPSAMKYRSELMRPFVGSDNDSADHIGASRGDSKEQR